MVQRIERAGAELELGYWAIRGLGQPIRFLLVFVEVPFVEVRYGLMPDGSPVEDEDRDWRCEKNNLRLPFPNLPYLIDSSGPTGVRLTQSNAIMRYLARRFNLYGDSDTERNAIDVLQDEAYDFRNWITKTAYTLGEAYQAAFAEFEATAVPRYLDGFERYLDERGSHTHFVGERVCLVDFILYELLWQTSLMVPGSINESNHPCLLAFISAFAKLPPISAYMASSDYIERPINSDFASFH